MKRFTRNIGMLLLAIWLIAWGLFELIPALKGLGLVLAILAIAAGIFILLEKSHVVDYHRDSSNTVAARLFRSEHKSKIPAHRRLGSYSGRYRRHTHHITLPWGWGVVNVSCSLKGFQ
jgi:hypothetical protein